MICTALATRFLPSSQNSNIIVTIWPTGLLNSGDQTRTSSGLPLHKVSDENPCDMGCMLDASCCRRFRHPTPSLDSLGPARTDAPSKVLCLPQSYVILSITAIPAAKRVCCARWGATGRLLTSLILQGLTPPSAPSQVSSSSSSSSSSPLELRIRHE